MNISSWHVRIGVFMYTRGSGKTWFMYGAHLSSYQKNTKKNTHVSLPDTSRSGQLARRITHGDLKFPFKCCHAHQNISKCKHHLPCSWAHPRTGFSHGNFATCLFTEGQARWENRMRIGWWDENWQNCHPPMAHRTVGRWLSSGNSQGQTVSMWVGSFSISA